MELQQCQITIPLDAIRSNDREGRLTVHIQGQPMDHTLTCDVGDLDSDFRVDDSEHGQVSLSDSSNGNLPHPYPSFNSNAP